MKKMISLCLASVMALALCNGAGATAGMSVSEDGIITIRMSEEAQKYAEENAEANAAGKALLGEDYFEQLLETYYARTEDAFPECTVQNKLDSGECAGSKVYTLSNGEDHEKIVLYIHGGAWMNGIGTDHIAFCDALVGTLNAKVYMPLYPLAPQATSKETYAMVETLYKELLKEGKPIYLMGDSAGGNIALGLLYTIKQEGLAAPVKTVLLSPCTDMSFSNEAMTELNKIDPMLNLYGCRRCAALWAGEENLKNPKNSALYADVTGYPDIMIVQGTNDILYEDTVAFYEKLKAAGVNATLVVGEGLWHVFPVDPIPEMDTVLELIKQF